MLIFASTFAIKREAEDVQLDMLIQEISAGNQAALEQLYQYTHSSIYGFALSILKNSHDAEDALHDCYITVWHGAVNYRSQGKPLAWLMTITKNLCLQQLRKSQKTTDLSDENRERYFADRAELTADDRIVLSTCMEYLSDQERQIVMLHAISGFKHREIADLLELPLSTVLSKYSRAIRRLKKYLQ